MRSPSGSTRAARIRRGARGTRVGLLISAVVVFAVAGGPNRPDLFPGRLIGAGARPGSPVLADFDGDGIADLAVANRDSGDVSVVLGRGDGTFGPQTRVPAGRRPSALAAGDFDGDGRPDLAAADALGGGVIVLLGRGDGTFAALPKIDTTPAPSGLAAADFDGDGRLDLAVADLVFRRVVVLLGVG